MKNSTRIFTWLLIGFFLFATGQAVQAQSILDPTDSVVTYNPNNPPPIPAYGSIAKWVRTKRMSWNTNNWKCYIYNGRQFRLRFPKTYQPGVSDGKLYPMMIFMHGDGEGSTVYDNEYSLFHGGNIFENAVANGTFDGYILVMQTSGSWGPNEWAEEKYIIDYMIANNKLDPFRVTANGLSAGGAGCWGLYQTYPTYPAGILPMSSVAIALTSTDSVNKYKFTPIWNIHGGLDGSPAPYTAQQVLLAMQAGGANYTDLDMVTQGHDTWDSTWSMPAFWPWLLKQYSSNPWCLFGRTQFCKGDNINLTVGLVAGFQAYQWRKNGVLLSSTGNTIHVTDTGTYDARVERNGIWSDWSHTPVVVSYSPPTVTPDITVGGLMSKVIPAPDGNAGVTLSEPTGYATYVWQQAGNNNSIGSANTIYANTPGQYTCQVTQQFGCSSSPSQPFTVISANGPNKPDPASGLVVGTLSPTSLVLNWSQNPAPAFNETNFEIYQSTHTGGPYKLVAITGQDVSSDTITGLLAGVRYYYIIRAVNNTGASANSAEASGSTTADTQAPTAPGSLVITGSSRTSISLDWTASTDNVGVSGYYVYVNGAKSYVVSPSQTAFTVGNLTYGQSYSFYITAFDSAGNVSPASGQVSGEPLFNGFNYQFYTFSTSPSKLPDFSTLTPASSGTVPNITLSPATQTTNYGFLFQGTLHVTQAGTYTFETSSDDGSAMYIGTLNSTQSAYVFGSTPLVNNDGAHGTTTVASKAVTLQPGLYPLAVVFFQAGGGQALSILWKTPGSSSFVTIPNSAFADAPVNNGQAPNAPSNLVATALSYNQIGLTWTDNSSNEAGFEVWRSTSPTTGFVTIGTVANGVTSFIDSTVSASTRYYYEVRADNLYGQSPFVMNYTKAEWKFNNNYADSTGDGYTLTAVGSPTFDATNKAEGGWAIKFSGSNQGATIPNTGGFLTTGYNQLTVAGWVKANTTGSNRVIFDIGGSDNGLALVLNNSVLTAAVASANVRANITATITPTNWNHVAVVYNGDTLQLYVNGALVASNNALSFHALANTSNASRFGMTNGTNALNTTGSAFAGWIDDFSVSTAAYPADVIQTLYAQTYHQSNATTLALPAIPAAPGGLTATAVSSSAINLSWTNNSSNATSVQVYRSANNDQQFVLWATLPATATAFADSGLFANAKYYYEVRAVNAGGNSAFTPEASATTQDNLPVISKLAGSVQARYGTTTTFNLSATSANSGALIFSSGPLPAFAHLTDNGDRTATLTVNPAASDAGNYPGLFIAVTDGFGGSDTTKFNLAVNNNYAPVLDSVANYTISEGDTLTIPLTGMNSQNPSDTLSFAVANTPGGSVLTPVSNGTANLFVHPNYAAAGTYNVKVTLNDNNGLSAMQTFVLTVKDKSPVSKVFAHVSYNDANSLGLPWNPLLGTSASNLVDSAGNVTNLGLQFSPANWWTPFNGGATTGNNSGVYPDIVLQDYMWFGSVYGGPNEFDGTVTGADTAQLYDLTFFASSVYNGFQDNGWTAYTAGGQTKQLHVQGNTQNTVTLTNIKPNADGTIPFAMTLGQNNTQLGYFNAIVITKHFDDGSAPAGISGLTAANAPSQVQLSWTDSAYNATGYEVWRSLTSGGTSSLLATVPGNSANSYTDSSVSGNTGYTYRVRAVNANGTSVFDSVSTVTLNRLPKINPVANIMLKDTSSLTLNVTTVDDSTAHLTLTAANLPAFANFTDNGNGTGVLTITPSAGTVGVYQNVTITATDGLDSAASTTFSIAITEADVQSVYVNFTGGASCPAPWNTFTTPPFQGSSISNLTDDSGTPTGISATLLDGWYWFGVTGTANGNTNGILPSQLVYPPSVVGNFYYDPSGTQRRIQFSGLDNSKQYNFVFFNSQWDGTNGLTTFIINNDSVQLQPDWNINQTVQLNGIRPVNGVVTVIVRKAAGAANAYLNSIVIQGYAATTGNLLSPADLRALTVTQTTVSLQWQDRSAIETGYEVWRASDNSGSYSLIATLPANSTTYVDKGLTRGTNYYYIVRAVNGSSHSNYSSPLALTTYSDAIYIHPSFTSAGNAPTPPWNNLNAPGGVGTTWNNFIDSTGAVTSVGMVQTGEFAGANSLGDVTGNNSGVYPDPVLLQQYVLFPGNFGAFTVSGLNLSKVYDFTFFGSENYEGGNNNTAYVVNGDTVYLNALDNTNATVTLHGVVPDAMGQANITMFSYGESQVGWFNAMVIQGYTPTPGSAPNTPQSTGGAITPLATTVSTMPVVPQAMQMDTVVRAYPNPFHTSFTLSVPVTTGEEKVMVTLYDATGRLVYRKEFDNVSEGMNYLQVGADASIGGPGIYLAKVVFSSGRATQSIKLLKN
ncbi:MAG TPA: fibronectin type III domain-containing protein [Puia sp.]|nr:fibronectin type III domain-containing protein [Puia sp.]